MSKMPLNPWLSMWVKPKETVKVLIQNNPRHRFFLLAFLIGWPLALYAYFNSYYNNFDQPIYSLLGSLVLGVLLGAAGFVIQAFFLFITGKILKGKASFKHMLCAVSWSHIPTLLLYLFFITIYIFSWLFPMQDAQGPMANIGLQQMFLLPIFCVVSLVWYTILLVSAVSQVQNFSLWRSIGNILLVPIGFYIVAQVLGFLVIYVFS